MAASYGGAEWSYEESNSNENSPEDDSVCALYQSQTYMRIAMLAASMGTVSTLASVAVILVIVIFKKYNFFIQRLILYLCITAALNSASVVLRFSRATDQFRTHNLCVAAAFIDQTTKWSLCIAYVCLTFNMLFTVVFNTSTKSIEIGYLIAIFLFPLTFNWVPFLHDSYGEAGAWCWIRSKDMNYTTNYTTNITTIDCTTHRFGVYLQYSLWYVPHYAILCIVIIAYIMIVAKLISNARHWKGLYSMESTHQKERMKELVKPIIFYPLVYLLLNLFPLINRIYETAADKPNRVLWILHALFSPLQGGFIALLYVLDRDTVHRLNPRELLAYLLHRKTPIEEYPVKQEITDSLEKFLSNESKEDVMVGFTKETRYGSLVVSERTLKGNHRASEKGL